MDQQAGTSGNNHHVGGSDDAGSSNRPESGGAGPSHLAGTSSQSNERRGARTTHRVPRRLVPYNGATARNGNGAGVGSGNGTIAGAGGGNEVAACAGGGNGIAAGGAGGHGIAAGGNGMVGGAGAGDGVAAGVEGGNGMVAGAGAVNGIGAGAGGGHGFAAGAGDGAGGGGIGAGIGGGNGNWAGVGAGANAAAPVPPNDPYPEVIDDLTGDFDERSIIWRNRTTHQIVPAPAMQRSWHQSFVATTPPDPTEECPICREMFDDPVQTSGCRHIFCWYCIDQVRYHAPAIDPFDWVYGHPKCPLCRKYL